MVLANAARVACTACASVVDPRSEASVLKLVVAKRPSKRPVSEPKASKSRLDPSTTRSARAITAPVPLEKPL